MNIDPILDVDQVSGAVDLGRRIRAFEKSNFTLVNVTSSWQSVERLREAVCGLRASNISAILRLRRADMLFEDEEIAAVFAWLRDWDQLLIFNFLEVCGEWVPVPLMALLEQEAKIELKWFTEWQTATSDPRIHKYPGLPWRSFLRKINAENYAFSMDFLRIAALPSSAENRTELEQLVMSYLERKKKAVCIFPKRWGAHMKKPVGTA